MRAHFWLPSTYGPPAVRRLREALLLLLAVSFASPHLLAQTPKPRRSVLFSFDRLFLGVNRVECGLTPDANLCTSSALTYDGIGGALWPRGTSMQYVFNAGPAVAGIVGPDGGPWSGDTAGGFFFDPKGTTQHGSPVTRIFWSRDAGDSASWPAEARVPANDIYAPLLQGRIAASDGDAWLLAWEGDVGAGYDPAGRPHPLGIVAEVRALAWNYPVGNDDIQYFIITFYNVSSLDPADYAGVRPSLRALLLKQAATLHQHATDAYGVTLPQGGYTVEQFYAGLGADEDVGDAGMNYASTAPPLGLAFAWESRFQAFPYFFYDPAIFSSPFFPAFGFVGTALLGGPGRTGAPARQTQFTNTTNGGGFGDARNIAAQWRLLSGNETPADGTCTFDPASTGICFVRTTPYDVRSWQSQGPWTLPPGGSVSFPVAFVFAAPVGIGATATCPACDIQPYADSSLFLGLGNPTVIGAPSGPGTTYGGTVNPVDSVAGFLGARDVNADGVLDGDEFVAAPRSLYQKAQIARLLFANGFVLPQAPAAPDFFLVPGDNSVTVIWRPSASEATGDPYFALAHGAVVRNDAGSLVPNPLYDPNYRQYDVEGYRIYRGRVDDPSTIELVAQFDYQGTVISDYSGLVATRYASQQCAPELGATSGCPVGFDPVQPGVARTVHADIPLSDLVIQTRPGDRFLSSTGLVIVEHSDTTGAADAGLACLCDTGVPFIWTDHTVRNGLRYFYSVTAFDVNSLQSGPASQESPRLLKPVTPAAPASNVQSASTVSVHLEGRGTALDPTQPLPTLDPVSGRFSGPFPPANGWDATVQQLVPALLPGSGEVRVRLDSILLGNPYAGFPGTPHRYWWTASGGGTTVRFEVPLVQNQETGVVGGQHSFAAIAADAGLAARFGGGGGYAFQATLEQRLPGPEYETLYGRGCLNGRAGFAGSLAQACAYNGSRWFDGPSPQRNETKAHPNEGNPPVGSGQAMSTFNNAGQLTGVVTIHNTIAYETVGGLEYRPTQGVQAGAHRAADLNVYWGAGGMVDSVIDATHNVAVPFDSLRAGGTWGVLNQAAATASGSYDQRSELTNTDMGCVEPFRSDSLSISCGSAGPRYVLSRRAVPGPIAMFDQALANARTAPAAPNAGFIMYLAGDWFTFELQSGTLPPPGAVWTLRQYVGAISGGGCPTCGAGDLGPYQYSNPEGTLPLTAVGAEIVLRYDVMNQVLAPTATDLSRVHTVPDPYYLNNAYEADAGQQVIEFVNLPRDCVIRIYSSSGILVRLLEHHTADLGGTERWNVRTRDGRRVASGVYFYHLEAGNARRVGRMTVINAAPGY